MPIIVSQVKASLKAKKEEVVALALKRAGIKQTEVKKAELYKSSLDARKQDDIKFVHSVYLELNSEQDEQRICASRESCSFAPSAELSFTRGNRSTDGRIVVVGFGPAGMFAALTLAENGYKPLVLERGAEIAERVSAVEGFWKRGELDENTNVQFGEGGAGTFSDGKLTTRINDPMCRYVLEKFAQLGAPDEILTKAKPHIGTDKLRKVVKAARERITALGGEVRFKSRVTDFLFENGQIKAIKVNDEEIKAAAVVLAVGHSARDTFETLISRGVFIEPKAFSVGARIEHTRESVNRSLYGRNADNPLLPQGEYQLSYRQGDRGVYTFCMCPGGYVVPSSSESGGVVTNGMSEFSRSGKNSNAAIVVSVSESDFGASPLGGVEFARKIERQAFLLGGENYKAPAVSVGSFLENGSEILKGGVLPTYSTGVTPSDFDKLFPSFVTSMMRDGIRNFATKMRCFGEKTALLTGAETRTSSPVRIKRGENGASVSAENLYPAGEGAGYAGGIMSAAVDGIKASIKIMEIYKEM